MMWCRLHKLVTLSLSKGLLYIYIADRLLGLRQAQPRTNGIYNLTTFRIIEVRHWLIVFINEIDADPRIAPVLFPLFLAQITAL